MTLDAELDVRRGLLGKGALLTVTSQPARTSPVTRGKWFLQTFLGVPPPDPPPNVPALEAKAGDTTGNAQVPTMREQMSMHRDKPLCSTCHKIFDRWASRWRTSMPSAAGARDDGGQPIDARDAHV